ncbi:hypothetical protein VNO78_27100 [Psophocarpus tetragonolobus]|uniref:Uncharacterized protein n=1 Tax=Psophocarpus tetragonolobus TaxID=3891 RepID=A0AAN9S059_PSOTE
MPLSWLPTDAGLEASSSRGQCDRLPLGATTLKLSAVLALVPQSPGVDMGAHDCDFPHVSPSYCKILYSDGNAAEPRYEVFQRFPWIFSDIKQIHHYRGMLLLV